MKVAVEVDVLAREAKTGVYYYLQRLLGATLMLDQANEYTLVYFGQTTEARGFGLPLSGVKIGAISHFPQKLYRLLLRTPFAPPIDHLARVQPDLFIFPAFVRWPLRRTKKSIVVVYDTAYIDHPEVIATRRFQRYLAKAVPRSIKQATKVIAISENTKASLIHHYGTPADKIAVITPALDQAVYQPAKSAEIDRVKAKYQLTRPYLLHVGTLEPRKNIAGIIEAYRALPEELRQKYQLVLGGERGWQDEAIQQAMATLSPEDLIVTGYVAEEDMAPLYSGASVFIYPSLFEGWGMQPLEAMACGVPVVTSNNSSLPEVVGDGGMMVEARDALALAEAIGQILSDSKLRERLRTAGLKQAQLFSWEASARKLLNIIKTI